MMSIFWDTLWAHTLPVIPGKDSTVRSDASLDLTLLVCLKFMNGLMKIQNYIAGPLYQGVKDVGAKLDPTDVSKLI